MEVLRDRLAELWRPVHPEREPELQRTERPRVLERDVHRMQLVLLMRQVALLVRERSRERAVLPHQDDPARLRQVEPLVRVDGDRVGALKAGEEAGVRRDRSGGQPVRTVHVEPHASLGADVGDRGRSGRSRR